LIPPLEAALVDKLSNVAVSRNDKIPIVDISSHNSASSDWISIKITPFDSSHRAGSNGGIFILLPPLGTEIFNEMSKIGILSFRDTAPFDILSNNSASRGGRRTGIPPFEPARRD